jgi:tetratricopeptide (TPR) repeat protein
MRTWAGFFLCTIVIAMFCANAPLKAQAIDIDKALQDKPVQDRAQSYYHYALAKWYDDDEDLAKALAEMKLAALYNENEASVHTGLADLLMRLGNTTEAVNEAQKAALLDPKNPEPHWLLATFSLRAGEGNRENPSADSIRQAVKELELMKSVAPDDQRAYYALGQCYMELNQPDKAIAALERWQTLVPDSNQGYITIAQYYDGQGNPDKAIEYLQKAVELQPDSVQTMAVLADAYSKAKREKDAIPLYRKMIELTGGNPGQRKKLAATLLDNGESEEALKLMAPLVLSDPQDSAARMLLARAQVAERKYTDAVANLKSLLKNDPDDFEAKFYLGGAYEQSGQGEEAVKIFAQLIESAQKGSEELKPNIPVFQQHMALSYQDMGDYAQAIAIYENMVKSDPSPRTYFSLINAYRIDRQLDKALVVGKQQFEKNPKDENLALVYARTLADAGKVKDGAAILDKMLQANPENLDLYINLSQIYIQAKRFEDAEKVLRRGGENKLDKERIKFQLATMYDKQREYDKAESLLKEILKENPNDGSTLNYLGYMLAERGVRLDEAIRYVEQALTQEPNNPAYLDSLGWAFFKKNDFSAAEKYLLQAGEMERKDPVIQDHIGDLYYRNGNLERAQEFYKKSLNSGGEPEDALKVRSKLEKVQDTLRKQKKSE